MTMDSRSHSVACPKAVQQHAQLNSALSGLGMTAATARTARELSERPQHQMYFMYSIQSATTVSDGRNRAKFIDAV
jgi:hypothetical protein